MDDSGVCPDRGTGIFGDPRLLELGRWVTEEVVACYFVALNLGLNFFVYFVESMALRIIFHSCADLVCLRAAIFSASEKSWRT